MAQSLQTFIGSASFSITSKPIFSKKLGVRVSAKNGDYKNARRVERVFSLNPVAVIKKATQLQMEF